MKFFREINKLFDDFFAENACDQKLLPLTSYLKRKHT